jgi:hypothetical protein
VYLPLCGGTWPEIPTFSAADGLLTILHPPSVMSSKSHAPCWHIPVFGGTHSR